MRTNLLSMVELRLKTRVRGVAQGLEYTEHAQGPGSVPALQNNNRTSKPPDRDKYQCTHRHYFKSKVCLMLLARRTSVDSSLVLLLQTAKRGGGCTNAGYLVAWFFWAFTTVHCS